MTGEQAGAAETTVLIEPMTAADVARCAELERLLFGGEEPWSPRVFQDALEAGHHFLVARENGVVIGYAGLARLGAEAEVHNIGVDPAHQRRGIGRALLRALLHRAPGATVFLEVRTDNEPAINLYRSEGFAVIGTRRRYYRPSGADAFTMSREPAEVAR